jgi:hypothetical protein
LTPPQTLKRALVTLVEETNAKIAGPAKLIAPLGLRGFGNSTKR